MCFEELGTSDQKQNKNPIQHQFVEHFTISQFLNFSTMLADTNLFNEGKRKNEEI